MINNLFKKMSLCCWLMSAFLVISSAVLRNFPAVLTASSGGVAELVFVQRSATTGPWITPTVSTADQDFEQIRR
ncbi:hypothetical protein HDV57DRAFT_501868 [Trichoderma longibrachiatum]